MTIFLSILSGVIAGIIIGFLVWGRRDSSPAAQNDKKIDIPERFEVKNENLEKFKEHITRTSDKITNDMVQEVLGVSDATAVRYLDELEKSGIIKQVGKTGKYTYYEKV
jgi:Fic family protein